jgi:hypothetical protein
MSRCILNAFETGHGVRWFCYYPYLISIRLYFILTILITENGPQPSFFNDCNFNSAVIGDVSGTPS